MTIDIEAIENIPLSDEQISIVTKAVANLLRSRTCKLVKRQTDRPSVIDAYNAATPIAQALTEAGYKKYGNRWLSPNSTTKIPGVVVFDDGKAYSHHASDPFDLEHSFDSFEVFCQYNHAGNVKNAVRAAAELLHMDSMPESERTATFQCEISENVQARSEALSKAMHEANLNAEQMIRIGEIFLNEGTLLYPDLGRWRLTELVLQMPIFDRSSTQWAKAMNSSKYRKIKGDGFTLIADPDPQKELTYYLQAEAKERASMASNMERKIVACAMLVRLPKVWAKKVLEAVVNET